MKSLFFALILVALVASGMALDCYQCQPKKAGGACEITTVTCPAEKDACVSARFCKAPYGHYQRCSKMADCELLKLNAYVDINCCQDDLCNKLWSSRPLTFHTDLQSSNHLNLTLVKVAQILYACPFGLLPAREF